MRAERFQHQSHFDVSLRALWDLHMAPDALRRLTPGLMLPRIQRGAGPMREGLEVEIRVGLWPLRQRWHVLHTQVQPGGRFVDVGLRTPFRYWVHEHRFESVRAGASLLTDVVWFVPPRWLPGRFGRLLVRLGLRLLFMERHRRTRAALGRPVRGGRPAGAPTRPAACCGES